MKKMTFLTLSLLVVLTITFAGCSESNNQGKVSGENTTTGTVSSDLVKQSYVKGHQDAKVTIVEFTDFQCPACGYAYTQMKEVLAKYSDKIKFGVRHFPLSYHAFALEATYAAEAAGLQGKFWEMYDLIFTNQNGLSSQKFLDFAQGLNLDMEKFKTDKDSSAVKEKVANDLKDAQALNLNGTPTFFINNIQFSQSFTAQNIGNQIEKLLTQ